MLLYKGTDQNNIEKLDELYQELTKTYKLLMEVITSFIGSLDESTHAMQIEDDNERLKSVENQFAMIKRSYCNAIKEHNTLKKDLKETSKKNTVPSVKTSKSRTLSEVTNHTVMSYCSLTPQQRARVAESEVKIAKIEVDRRMVVAELAKPLATNSLNNGKDISDEVNVKLGDHKSDYNSTLEKVMPHGDRNLNKNDPYTSYAKMNSLANVSESYCDALNQLNTQNLETSVFLGKY